MGFGSASPLLCLSSCSLTWIFSGPRLSLKGALGQLPSSPAPEACSGTFAKKRARIRTPLRAGVSTTGVVEPLPLPIHLHLWCWLLGEQPSPLRQEKQDVLVGTTAGLLRAAGTRQYLSGWGPSICLWLQVGPEEGTLKPASLLSPQLSGAAAKPTSPLLLWQQSRPCSALDPL